MSTPRDYQALLILSPDLTEETGAKVQKQFGELIARQNGRVMESAVLGKRKLSFKIGKWSEGVYVQARIQVLPAEIVNIKKAATLIEGLLRLMIIQGHSASAINSFKAENAPQPVETEQTETEG